MTDDIETSAEAEKAQAEAAAKINAENEAEASALASAGAEEAVKNAEEAKRAEMAKNKAEVLEFADKLYAQMLSPEVRGVSAEDRHQFIFEHFRNFYDGYPTVARHMALGLTYRRKSFEKLLDKMANNPGGGMEAYCGLHADYVKFLYIELEKEKKHHINQKEAYQVWRREYDTMFSAFKQIRQIEREKKSEFEREKAETLEFKRQQLFDFLETVDPAKTESVNMDELTSAELAGIYNRMLQLESKCLDALADRNEFLRVLEERDMVRAKDDWIPEHVKKITKKKRRNLRS